MLVAFAAVPLVSEVPDVLFVGASSVLPAVTFEPDLLPTIPAG